MPEKLLDLRKSSRQIKKSPPKRRAKKSLIKAGLIKSQKDTPLPNKVKALKKPYISWRAPSFYYNPQKKYLSLVIIALVSAGGGLLFFQKDTLTAIFLILVSLVIILYSSQKPGISKIVVNELGIAIDKESYFYKDLKSFWINYNPRDIKELSIESGKWYMPYIKVSIEDQNPLELRSLLVSFLPEKEHENSLIDILARKIGL